MKTIITMTSWRGRINMVGYAIFRFMVSQTVLPDKFYLWLSTDEFPGRYKDLPVDLVKTCHYFDVKIKWIKANEYCFKRWYTCLHHYSDIVISIDDDVFYDPTLVQRSIDYARQYTNTVINIGSPMYKPLSFNNSINRVLLPAVADTPLYNMQLCGQSIFLPNTFPTEIIDGSMYCTIRQAICKKCDECGITPLLVKHNIPIIAHNWHNVIDLGMQNNAVSNDMRNIKNLQLYLVIRSMPGCMDAWKTLYPSYNTSYYDAMPLDAILSLM